MRERSQTTPRRRKGPKQPLPRTTRGDDFDIEGKERFIASESPYYTIDNTEDIYGTTLLPSQRCYVDPWDLENYDYVRKKIGSGDIPQLTTTTTTTRTTGDDFYETSLTPSPIDEHETEPNYGYYQQQEQSRHSPGLEMVPRMASTMPRPHTRRTSRFQCQLECCVPQQQHQQTARSSQTMERHSRSRSRRRAYPQELDVYATRSELYGGPNRYDDYMAQMTRQLHLDEDLYMEQQQQQQQIYNGYGGQSSSSSTEHQHASSIGSEDPYTMQRRKSSNLYNIYGYGTAPLPMRKKSKVIASRVSSPRNTPPHIDFPAPPLSPSPYDYCNPYATLPYCSIPDCYDCQTSIQDSNVTSLIYAAPNSIYGTTRRGQSASPVSNGDGGSGGDSSLYAGIYANKFALSKKGLLQIDYSCSWNDLDRVMGRQY